MNLILINFSGHSMTEEQKTQVMDHYQTLAKQTPPALLYFEPDQRVLLHFDKSKPYYPQAALLFDSIPFTREQLENSAVVVAVPSNADIAAFFLAVYHGRVGRFPAIVRRREHDMPPFIVAEIANLETIRQNARQQRYQGQP